jgi:DNA-binding HxlR family transcriptional regulator
VSTTQHSVEALRKLVDQHWALPVLAELGRTGGSRFVPLANAVGANRQSVRRALDALIAEGLVAPNPGYGHPSRPEYLITDAGRRLAPTCAAVVAALSREEVADLGRRRWTLPVLVALGTGRRFSELKAEVPGVTSRALALTLKELIAAGLVERTVHGSFPPHTSYRPTTRSVEIVGEARGLASLLSVAA